MDCLFVAYGWPHGWLRVAALTFAAVSIAIPLLMQIAVAVSFEISPLYALTQPIGAILVAWMILRSTYVTLKNDGVSWRGTFYSLNDLRRGMV